MNGGPRISLTLCFCGSLPRRGGNAFGSPRGRRVGRWLATDVDNYLSIGENLAMSRMTSATAKAKGSGGSPSGTSHRAQITTSRAPAPTGPYSQAIVANGFVFASGQRPVDPTSGIIPTGIQAQTRQVMTNLSAVLEAAGTTLGDVVKVTVHLADLSMFGAFNLEYGQWFERPYPTRTTVGSELRGILVEVDVVAVQGQSGAGATR